MQIEMDLRRLDLFLVYMNNEIDLSEWDPRTQELARKYDLKKDRLASWKRNYEDNMKLIELEYLRHLGEQLIVKYLDLKKKSHIRSEIIQAAENARSILLLFLELDVSESSGRRFYIKYNLKSINLYLEHAPRD